MTNSLLSVLQSSRKVLSTSRGVYVFLLIFVVIGMILQWAFQIDVLKQIVTNEGLGFFEKIQQFFRAYTRLYTLADFTPVAILVVSFLQAMAVAMLIEIKSKLNSLSLIRSSIISMVGTGCVSCGGSLITAFVSLFVADVSLATIQYIGSTVLIIAIVLSLYSLGRISIEYEKVFKT